ncbi:MAG: GIY-YIG nuclease family protein [Patescibacteria group bacterium]|nr:GIY-YIG nuclease family protein [Patescibacteria group bacterium]
MHLVYILQSLKDKKMYVGITGNLRLRLGKHRQGEVQSTKNRRPWKLIGYEAYLTKEEAAKREKYLKTSDGKREIKIRFKKSLLQ